MNETKYLLALFRFQFLPYYIKRSRKSGLVLLCKCTSIFVILSPVEYLTVEYSTFKTFEKTIITINLDPPQTSQQIYRKLKYRHKVFEEFQRLPRFPRKMVLYSSTTIGILKP